MESDDDIGPIGSLSEEEEEPEFTTFWFALEVPDGPLEVDALQVEASAQGLGRLHRYAPAACLWDVPVTPCGKTLRLERTLWTKVTLSRGTMPRFPRVTPGQGTTWRLLAYLDHKVSGTVAHFTGIDLGNMRDLLQRSLSRNSLDENDARLLTALEAGDTKTLPGRGMWVWPSTWSSRHTKPWKDRGVWNVKFPTQAMALEMHLAHMSGVDPWQVEAGFLKPQSEPKQALAPEETKGSDE
jgi:hypothetical protein